MLFDEASDFRSHITVLSVVILVGTLLVKSGDNDGHEMKSGVLDGHITEKPRTYLSMMKTCRKKRMSTDCTRKCSLKKIQNTTFEIPA